MNLFAQVTDEKALLVGPLQAPGWTGPTLLARLFPGGGEMRARIRALHWSRLGKMRF